MSFRSSYRGRRDGHEAICNCDHARMAHYSKEGGCVFPECGCPKYRAKGRQEYATAKRARCELGHSHDSGLEIKECFDLEIQRRAGEIRSFRFHPVIELSGPSGRTIATYEVDFEVTHLDGTTEFVETKGAHLQGDPAWRLKWKLLQDKFHGQSNYKFRVRLG